jgi:hypothetical protein
MVDFVFLCRSQGGGVARKPLPKKKRTASTRKIKNRILAASNDRLATPPNPRNAEISATTKKINARRSMDRSPLRVMLQW